MPPAAVCGVDADGCAEALRLARCFRALAFVFGGLQGSFAGRRLFRGGPNGRLARSAPAMAWRDQAMKARRAMACARAWICRDRWHNASRVDLPSAINAYPSGELVWCWYQYRKLLRKVAFQQQLACSRCACNLV